MAVKNEPARLSDWLRYEDDARRSRDVATILSGVGVIRTGLVLARVLVGAAAVAAAFAGNTGGSGAVGAVTVAGNAKLGTYKVTIIEPASNAGKFIVEDPSGILVGTGNVASAFSGGGLGFTISDATDFVSGDGFDIVVSGGGYKWVAYDPTGTDGRQFAAGILVSDLIDATSADAKGVILARHGVVARNGLSWGAGVTTSAHKAAAEASLAALGIITRTGA